MLRLTPNGTAALADYIRGLDALALSQARERTFSPPLHTFSTTFAQNTQHKAQQQQ